MKQTRQITEWAGRNLQSTSLALVPSTIRSPIPRTAAGSCRKQPIQLGPQSRES
jgi:hypothetical protein